MNFEQKFDKIDFFFFSGGNFGKDVALHENLIVFFFFLFLLAIGMFHGEIREILILLVENAFYASFSKCVKTNATKTYEPAHDKTYRMAYMPSEDSDQPGHPPSLIRVFAVYIKKASVLSYPVSTPRRVLADWVDAQADLSSLGTHAILLVLPCAGSYNRYSLKNC